MDILASTQDVFCELLKQTCDPPPPPPPPHYAHAAAQWMALDHGHAEQAADNLVFTSLRSYHARCTL